MGEMLPSILSLSACAMTHMLNPDLHIHTRIWYMKVTLPLWMVVSFFDPFESTSSSFQGETMRVHSTYVASTLLIEDMFGVRDRHDTGTIYYI